MAGVKKYAGLPDLDIAGTEIYESNLPDLTGGSTANQSSTLRTESPTPSENDNPNLVRYGLDRELARRRFEPTTVDARDVNFSDTIGGDRRDYQTGHRRRRRRRVLENGDEEFGYQSEDSEQEESLKSRIARLKREAEEVKAEIARLEKEKDVEDSDFHDSVEQQQTQADGQDLADGLQRLEKVLDGIAISGKRETVEEEFLRKLNDDPGKRPTGKGGTQDTSDSSAAPTMTAIGAFADRLTALETVLGISSVPSTGPSSSILPTLEILSTQIEALSTSLSPPLESMSSNTAASSAVHLGPVAERLRILISESKRLEDSRKSAAKTLEELIETRDRHSNLLSGTSVEEQQQSNGKNTLQSMADASARSREATKNLTSQLFLDEHAGKITALYNLLPTIQSLQPLLPTVLERLRALSVIHAGAADAKSETEDLESRLGRWEKDLSKWREAVEEAEKGMQENREIMKENFGVVGGMVKGLEGRMEKLQR